MKDGQSAINFWLALDVRHRQAHEAADAFWDYWRWLRWPGARFYTYVNPRRVRSANPGYCFKRAGWRACGITKTRKLLILEITP